MSENHRTWFSKLSTDVARAAHLRYDHNLKRLPAPSKLERAHEKAHWFVEIPDQVEEETVDETINRLQNEVEGLRRYIKEQRESIAETEADLGDEIERLREALEKIVTEPDAYTCRLTARQALERAT
jgi:septation ring formation regulator EzrA